MLSVLKRVSCKPSWGLQGEGTGSEARHPMPEKLQSLNFFCYFNKPEV